MRRTLVLAAVALAVAALPAAAADVTGSWVFTVELDMGSGNPTFDFQQDGETLTGTYHGIAGDAELTGTVKDNQIEFGFETSWGKITYQGTIEDDGTMKGTADYGGQASGTWTAKRAE